MADPIREIANAKVNLTLRVCGQRSDGYHEIASLVVFAGLGDKIVLLPGKSFALSIDGPFAGSLGGPNLVEKAARAVERAYPGVLTGATRLTKHLPVAAGLGGGSADAAAALRAIRRANRHRTNVDWPALAAGLGADVPVCLLSAPAWISGTGERVAPLSYLPGGWILLANPGQPLSTAAVFQRMAALDGPRSGIADTRPGGFSTLAGLSEYVGARGNDLEPAALALCPVISDVKAALACAHGALVVRMSGSGPTCFALFASRAQADAAADLITRSERGWWLAVAPIGEGPSPTPESGT